MIPILYSNSETSFDNNGIGSLCDATSCIVTEERNGLYEIELSYPINGALFRYLQEGCYVKSKPNETSLPQLFHIYSSSKPMNGIVTFYGEHISYELTGIPIEKVEFTGATGAQALNKVLSAGLIEHNYSGTSDITSTGSASLSILSVRAALGGVEGSLLDIYGGEYEFDNFTVKLHKSRGSDTGIIIGYGKNLTDVKQERNISETYTALFPYAKYTPEKDEDDTDEPKEIIVTLSEKIIHSSQAVRPKVLTMDFSDEFSDGEEISEENLRQKATEWAKTSGYNKPSVSINVSFVNLWQSPEYAKYALLERVCLCDTVTVNYEKLGIEAKAKVIKTVFDCLKEKYVSIELGDAKSNFADAVNKTAKEIETVKTNIKNSQAATANKITAAIAKATALITGQNGGYVVLNPSENPQEILIMDAPSVETAVKIWRWNSGGLGYSNKGYNGPYTIAITQDGQIVADFITAGEINGALIKADTVAAAAISQNFKADITKEISDNIAEIATTITQSFEAADGVLKSDITEKFKEYSTTAEMNSAISQNAESINLSVSERITETRSYTDTKAQEAEDNAKSDTTEKLKEYSTTAEMNSAIDIVKDRISLVVTETDNGNVINSASIITAINNDESIITLNANKINLTAYPKKSDISLDVTNSGTNSSLSLKCGDETIDTATIKITGVVKFSDLSSKGSTVINGDNVSTGKINAERIDTENLSCTALYAKGQPNGYSVRLNGSFGDFGIFNFNAADSETAQGSNCMFGIYQNDAGTINLYTHGNNFMGYNTHTYNGAGATFPKGIWDFTAADELKLPETVTAVAVFG